VSDEFLEKLFAAIAENPQTTVVTDLENQTLTVNTAEPFSTEFDINPYKKTCMINGYDDIDFLLSLEEKIETFEMSR
jgi:3-isopropylmalate/(R)-2-methylmalate dehydratase small subunit